MPMLSTVPNWFDIVSAVGTPRHRFAADLAVLKEFQHKGVDERFAPGLELQWLGTAGFRLTYAGTSILIDPYFTRPAAQKIVSRRAIPIDEQVVRAHVTACDGVLVGHTHFDHAMDVPGIARQTGCKVYGSTSLRTLMGLYGLAGRAVVVEHGKTFAIGPFEITFINSVHSKLLLGLKVPSDGEFTCDHLDDLASGRYTCGQVYGIHIAVAGVSFYHQGSANLIDENLVHQNIDYFLAGIAGRGFTPRYFERILRKLSPRVIIPNHFDNFFRPLGQPTAFSFNVNMAKFVDEVQAVSKDFEIQTLDLLQAVSARPPLA